MIRDEAHLARALSGWLTVRGWACAHEVSLGDGFADIVATKAEVTWVVETKMRLGPEVVSQACERAGYAKHISVAVPVGASPSSLVPWRRILDRLGFGLLEVECQQTPMGEKVFVHGACPEPHPKRINAAVLSEALGHHRNVTEPGSAGVSRWTANSVAIDSLERLVQANAGLYLADAVKLDTFGHRSRADAKRWVKAMVAGKRVKVTTTFENGTRLWPGGEE